VLLKHEADVSNAVNIGPKTAYVVCCLFYVKSLQQGRRARRMGNYKTVRQNRPIRSQYSAKKRSRSGALFWK
jgi:hypothetical protein